MQVPKEIRTTLAPLQPLITGEELTELPSFAGAYALIIHLDKDAQFTRAGEAKSLTAGWYLYAGNAYGSGGVRARLLRHFRQDKKVQWHIDQLTIRATFMAAAPLRGGSECGIINQLLETQPFEPSLASFGSSDCSACVSHLLRIRPALRFKVGNARPL